MRDIRTRSRERERSGRAPENILAGTTHIATSPDRRVTHVRRAADAAQLTDWMDEAVERRMEWTVVEDEVCELALTTEPVRRSYVPARARGENTRSAGYSPSARLAKARTLASTADHTDS